MKRNPKMELGAGILEYGKEKLTIYADSFLHLARSFENDFLIDEKKDQDRATYLYRKRLYENQKLLSRNMHMMAGMMQKIAEEAFLYQPLTTRKYKRIVSALKLEKIRVKNLYKWEEESRTNYGITMCTTKKGGYTSEEVGAIFSVLLGTHLVPSLLSPYFLDDVYRNYVFVEETRFRVFTGMAKAVKETEVVSGDNYSFLETEKGKTFLFLSDGMGSGEKACGDSDVVLDLMEKLIEAGYTLENAIQMVNSILAVKNDEQNMPTLDACELDLYYGICEFYKVGAAASFLKRSNLVEQISGHNLPLGVFDKPEIEVVRRRLVDGDFLIMISDGVMDGLEQSGGEDLCEAISKLTLDSPKEIAETLLQYVLHQCQGRIRDDMTILVAGIWEKN